MLEKKKYNIKIIIEQLKNYCVAEDKCKWDIIKKMNKLRIFENEQENILEILLEEKYIDEERYSRSFCRGKFKINKWGKLKIHAELRKKNISNEIITKGFKEINDLEYQEQLNNLYNKKKSTINEKNHFIKNNKIAIYLINKGYENDLVWAKLKE